MILQPTFVKTTVLCLEENSLLKTSLKCLVFCWKSVPFTQSSSHVMTGKSAALTRCANGGIDHDNIMLVVLMQVGHKLANSFYGKPLLVESKDLSTVHVIDIGPHRLQWDLGLAIVVNHLGNLIDITVAVFALMELRIVSETRSIDGSSRRNLRRKTSSFA